MNYYFCLFLIYFQKTVDKDLDYKYNSKVIYVAT